MPARGGCGQASVAAGRRGARELGEDARALKAQLKPVDFLKVAHHGSHNGTPMDLLDTLLPKSRAAKAKVLVSTKKNVYGTKNPRARLRRDHRAEEAVLAARDHRRVDRDLCAARAIGAKEALARCTLPAPVPDLALDAKAVENARTAEDRYDALRQAIGTLETGGTVDIGSKQKDSIVAQLYAELGKLFSSGQLVGYPTLSHAPRRHSSDPHACFENSAWPSSPPVPRRVSRAALDKRRRRPRAD